MCTHDQKRVVNSEEIACIECGERFALEKTPDYIFSATILNQGSHSRKPTGKPKGHTPSERSRIAFQRPLSHKRKEQ